MKTVNLAAIDIGSNAARLLITEVTETIDDKPEFNKLNLVRVPLRLGLDVFESGIIGTERLNMIIQTMQAYKHLIKVYGVSHVLACATSAMRDATNGKEIIEMVEKETGIAIEIISGNLEASIIYENHIAENLDNTKSYLYIDVGGGSTELTFFGNGKLLFKQSFNIGTIRLMKEQVNETTWNEMRDAIKNIIRGQKNIVAIGTGGNINKVFSLSKRKDGKPLQLDVLKNFYKELSVLSVAGRMKLYKLREDRADVIVPALQIYINVMRWAGADDIFVPKIGLADGLIQHLYSELQAKKV